MNSSFTSTHGGGGPAPPPPTPSNQAMSMPVSIDADGALSQFLNRLVFNQTTSLVSLSLPPPRFLKMSPSAPPPVQPPQISFIQPQHDLLLSAASDTGFFHLADHGIPSHLITHAMQESETLFGSKPVCNIRSSLGFNDEDEDEEGELGFLVFDTCSTELDAFPAIREYANNLEKVGLEVVQMILAAAGLCNPFLNGSIKPRCLMWVSSSSSPSSDAATNISLIKEEEGGEMKEKGRHYPHVVSLRYESKTGSLLAMLGDVAKVWSNGRFKKARGEPKCISPSSDEGNNLQSISMSLLVTLPMDSTISPSTPLVSKDCGNSNSGNAGNDGSDVQEEETDLYLPFSFEEYAWRVYHDRLPFKDPLLRYQI